MKLEAHLEVSYGTLNSSNSKRSNKPTYSQLSCVKDNSNKYILLINSSNKALTAKYNIVNNIEKVFCKFIEEGKATIKLKEPNLTLFIQKANPSQLKSFLKTLQLACTNKLQENETTNIDKTLQNSTNSILNKFQQEPPPIVKKPRTSMVTKGPADYIELLRCYKNPQHNFKTNLLKLEITEANMHQNQLHKHLYQYLTQLTYLNLSGNNLKNEINYLNIPSLKELNLSNNEIESFNTNTCYLPNLTHLNLSHNRMKYVTNKFCQLFKNVKELHLNANQIVCLNNRFGFYFKNLKVLMLHSNLLGNLPFSVINLRLEMFELDDNKYELQQTYSESNEMLKVNSFPKLVELSARCIVDKRISYSKTSIPATLDEYISNGMACVCGRACFNYTFKIVCLLALSKISQGYSYIPFGDSNNMVPTLTHLCSVKCYNKASAKSPLIIW